MMATMGKGKLRWEKSDGTRPAAETMGIRTVAQAAFLGK